MTDTRPQAPAFVDAAGTPLGHSPETANVRGVVLFAVGLVVMLVLSHAALIGLYFLLRAEQSRAVVPPSPFVVERAGELPPPPRLETNPTEGLQRLRLAEEVALESPAWFDAKTGRGHVPIERAMELVVEGRRAGSDAKPQAATRPSGDGEGRP